MYSKEIHDLFDPTEGQILKYTFGFLLPTGDNLSYLRLQSFARTKLPLGVSSNPRWSSQTVKSDLNTPERVDLWPVTAWPLFHDTVQDNWRGNHRNKMGLIWEIEQYKTLDQACHCSLELKITRWEFVIGLVAHGVKPQAGAHFSLGFLLLAP